MTSDKNVKFYSKIIDCCEEVPEYFLDGFRYSCLSCNDFPYTIHIIKSKEKEEEIYSELISVTRDGLYIFQRMNSRITMIQYNYEDLILIKKSTQTINSSIVIKGMVSGRTFKSIIEYDNKDKDIYDFIITSIRMKGKISLEFVEDYVEKYGEDNYELLKLDYFKESNLKLYNYSVESLLSGQKIKKTVLQKKLVRKKLKLVRKVLTASHISLLTNEELIIIQEGKSNRKSPEANIGGCWYFIPISQITSMDIKALDNYLLIFTIKLKGNDCVELIYETSNRAQLEQLVNSALVVYQNVK